MSARKAGLQLFVTSCFLINIYNLDIFCTCSFFLRMLYCNKLNNDSTNFILEGEKVKNSTAEKNYHALFDNFDKAKAFDEIAEFFYDMNFGSTSKSDIELLMFHFYMDAMIQANKIDNSDVISYTACSDYKMSQKLGITQQRVRNLKVKTELVYPQNDFRWEESLAYLLRDKKNVQFSKNDMVIINIPDPNLFYAIQDYIEEYGGYVEIHINRKILEMRKEYLWQFALQLESEEQQNAIKKYIQKELNKGKIGSIYSVIKTILETGANVVGILSGINGMLSPDNPFSCFLESII